MHYNCATSRNGMPLLLENLEHLKILIAQNAQTVAELFKGGSQVIIWH